jgi:hypothetical protein
MEIREVREDLIGAVKKFLADREGFRDANEWQGLFKYAWKLPQYPYGYVITEGDHILAFVGTIFSERVVKGQKRLFCNMNTWYVLEEHRHRMLALTILKPMLKLQDVLITAFTPADLTVTVLERLGFKLLDEEQVAVPITPTLVPSVRSAKRPLVMFDPSAIEVHLGPEDRKIYRDHASLGCTHFLIKKPSSEEYCYGVATTSLMRKLSFTGGKWLNVCYVSDVRVFAENFGDFRKQLWKQKFMGLCYDARLLPADLSKISVKRKKKRQYKWMNGPVGPIDNLYSELVTFNKY